MFVLLLNRLAVVVLILCTTQVFSHSQRIVSEIYYTSPKYALDNINITLGMVTNVANNKGMPLPMGLSSYLGVLCTMASINTKQAGLNLTGVINLVAINSNYTEEGSYMDFMNLLKLDLTSDNETVRQALKVPYPPPMGGMLGSGNFYQSAAVGPYLEGFRISSISFGSPSQSQQPDTERTVMLDVITESAVSVNPFATPDLAIVVTQFMWMMNFTLIAPIFQNQGVFGFEGVFIFQQIDEALDGMIQGACGSLIDPFVEGAEEEVRKFIQCINTYDTIEFIMLWTSGLTGMTLMKQLVDAGGKDLRFLIVAMEPINTQPPEEFWPYLEGSFFISETYEEVTEEDIETCLASIQEDPFSGIPNFQTYMREQEGCETFSNEGLPMCKKLDSGEYEETPCICNYYEYMKAQHTGFKYSLASDATMTFAQALYLLQNNCSYLNEYYQKHPATEGPANFCAIREFTPSILATAVSAVNFSAPSGQISFFRDTAVRKQANFNIYQWRENSTFVRVAQFINGKLSVDYSAISYPNGRAPTSRIVPSVPDFDEAYVVVFFSIMVVILLADVGVFVWLALNWKEKTVRRCSPLFLCLITIGIALVLVAGIVNSCGLDSSAACAVYALFLMTGITLILACILAKTWRIYQIFSNRSSSALLIDDKKLLLIPALFLLITLSLYFIYIFAGGLIEAVEKQGNANVFYTYIICESPTSWFQTFFLILFYCYLSLFVLGIAALGHMTRSIYVNYNESKHLAIIVWIYTSMAIIFIPLYYVQGSSSSSQAIRYVIISVNMCILMTVTLMVIFIPVIKATETAKQKRKLENN